MKRLGSLIVLLFIYITVISPASANDFDWLHTLNIKAEADSSSFRLRLATRFHIGDVTVKTVIGSVDRPSDAYMILRLGELSHRPVDEVIHVYRANRKKGWGAMAKSLGIKPGSSEFHALKRGHDLENGSRHVNTYSSGKGNGKGNGKGKNKHKGKK